MITYPNLYHLKYFVDAVKFGSISAAAQINLVTHPAVSRAIASLEDHLGVSLLDHQKKSFKPTEAGYKFAEQAQLLLSAALDFQKLSINPKSEEIVQLKIGLSRTLTDTHLKPLLRKIKKEFPFSQIQIKFGTTLEIVEAVANRSVDVGVTIGTLSLSTLKHTVLDRGEFVLALGGSKKNWSMPFEEQTFLITEPRPETEKLKTAYARTYGRPLPVLFEISSWEVISQMVREGAGIGLVPDICIKNWKKGEYKVLQELEFTSKYEVYFHEFKTMGKSRIVDFVKTECLGVK